MRFFHEILARKWRNGKNSRFSKQIPFWCAIFANHRFSENNGCENRYILTIYLEENAQNAWFFQKSKIGAQDICAIWNALTNFYPCRMNFFFKRYTLMNTLSIQYWMRHFPRSKTCALYVISKTNMLIHIFSEFFLFMIFFRFLVLFSGKKSKNLKQKGPLSTFCDNRHKFHHWKYI